MKNTISASVTDVNEAKRIYLAVTQWQPISDKLWKQYQRKAEETMDYDGAGIFALVGKTIARTQYGGTESLTFPNKKLAKAVWHLIQVTAS